MFKSITYHNHCDVFRGSNNIQPLGFDKTLSIGEMINLALVHQCPIIVKDGKGKWYLKGQLKENAVIEAAIEKGINNFPRQKCWHIVFEELAANEAEAKEEDEDDDKEKSE